MAVQELGKTAFLNLLTNQLKFQDPLKPMDSTAFVAQLAQFSSLEAALQTNKTLEGLVKGNDSMTKLGAANLLGRNVEAFGGKVAHIAGKAEKIPYQLDADASEILIQVVNEAGHGVKAFTVNTLQKKGNNQVLWDGRDNNGNMVKAGIYSYEGVAKDGNGKSIPIKIASEGEVSGVSYGEGGPFVIVNGATIPVQDIVRILK